MYDTILFPTDGGPGTVAAATRALDLARTFEATLHVLSVVDTASAGTGTDDEGTVRETLEERGHAATMTVQERAEKHDLAVVREVRDGVPHRAILDYVTETAAGLVVIATHSRANTREHHLGSTSERVLRRSEVPVMTVHQDGPANLPETRYGAYDRVVIPTDGSDVASRAAEHGLRIAERYGADVRVVYVVDTSTYGLEDAPRSIVGLLKEGGQEAVGDIAAKARDRNLSATATLLRGVPEDAILRYADGASADLLAVGTRGESGVEEQFIGSTTTRLVRRSTAPVLTVS